MNVATPMTGRTLLATSLLLSLLAVSPASADTLTVAWDANNPQVTGYVVYMGTQSGNLSQRYDVGNVLTYSNQNATPGQLYCFQVSAYIDPTKEGPRSNQVCGYSNQYPTLANPGNQTSATGQQVSLQLVGRDPDGRPVTYSATGLPGGLTLGASTGFIGGAATLAGTYTVTARASDGVLQSAAQTFTWSVTMAPADTTPSSVISPYSPIVLSGSSYSTEGSGLWMKVILAWTPVESGSVILYRDGSRVVKTDNDGSYIDLPIEPGPGPFTYQICRSGTLLSVCSNTIVVN
jgi:hypothetical protein